MDLTIVDKQMANQISEIIGTNLSKLGVKVASRLYGPVRSISKINYHGGLNCTGSLLFKVISLTIR